MPKFSIKYSKEIENDRVKDTISGFDWLKKNGYTPTFPQNLTVTDFNNAKKVEESIIADYDESKYKIHADYIFAHELDILPHLAKFIRDNIKMNAPDTYEIYLTRYGTGGSYRLPNMVMINLQGSYEFGLMKTIAHEIIHLSIEDLIKKHDINHWVKERVVYLLLSKCLPKYNKEHPLRIDPSAVDSAFKSYFPDMEKVLVEANKAY